MKKSTQQFADELKSKWNLTLVSEYLGAHNKIQFLCENNHLNEGAATNILQRGYKCKECKTGYQVRTIHWDENKVQQLQEFLNEGISTKEIAQFYHTTEASIHNAVAKFDIGRNRANERLLDLNSILASQNRTLVSPLTSIKSNILIKCSNNHTVSQSAANVLYKSIDCPLCFNNKPSKEEEDLRNFIKSNYNGWILENDRTILNGKELDIVLPDLGLAFEYNGTYWHSDKYIDKYYHLNKTIDVESIDYQLIHINSHTYKTKQSIVHNKILHLIKPQKAIGARLCITKPIDWLTTKEFLEQTHIQGSGAPTKYNYGLFHNNNLIAVATFGIPRFNKNYELELIRYSTSQPVVGALGKLLKYHSGPIISYANRDWSTGKLYINNGFELIGHTEPNYAYYKKDSKLSRYQTQKHLLKDLLPLFDPSLTEYENLENNGYYRVWDTGNLIFTRHHS